MPRYSATVPTWTTAATADTTNLADASHHTIQNGGTTNRCEIREIYVAGQAAASAPQILVGGRTSQVGTGSLTGGTRNVLIDATATAPATTATSFTAAATNKPQRATAGGMLVNLGHNAFGGIVRWQNGPDENVSIYGNTQPLGEFSVNAFTGTTAAAIATTIIYEAT
jgi:hypothetical protein